MNYTPTNGAKPMTETTPSYESLVENAPIGVFQAIVDLEHLEESTPDREHLYVNGTLIDILGFDTLDHFYEEVGSIEYAEPSDRDELWAQVEETGLVKGFETALVRQDGEPVDVLITGAIEANEFTGYVTDISERKRLERKAQEQAEAILQQSMPIVQIWKGITLATVVGTLDTERAQQLTEDLLTELASAQSTVALIDITGVPTIDTASSQHLIDTVNAVSLMGSKVIITGVNPEIAQTMVQLNIPMEEIRTVTTLSRGLELGLQLLPEEDLPTTESR